MFYPNSPKLGIVQVSIIRGMNKQTAVYLYNGVLLSDK